MALRSSRQSLGFLEEAWRGVDLINLTMKQRHAERIADDPDILRQWLLDEFMANESPPGAAAAIRAVGAASIQLPEAREAWQLLEWPGHYCEFHVHVQLLATGYYGLHVVERRVSFAVRWANPILDALELDAASEREHVLRQLRGALRWKSVCQSRAHLLFRFLYCHLLQECKIH